MRNDNGNVKVELVFAKIERLQSSIIHLGMRRIGECITTTAMIGESSNISTFIAQYAFEYKI